MKLSNSELRAAARADLSGQWGASAMLTFVWIVLTLFFNGTVGGAIDLWVLGLGSGLSTFLLLPMSWSYSMTFLANHRHENGDPFNVPRLFDGYRDFVRIAITMLLQYIFVVVGIILFVIPGIYLALAFALTPFILRDYPELGYTDALKHSMEMMRGRKLDLVLLYLSFIGWAILCIFTFGLGFLWLSPYITATITNFYEEVKREYAAPFQAADEEQSTTNDDEYTRTSGTYNK